VIVLDSARGVETRLHHELSSGVVSLLAGKDAGREECSRPQLGMGCLDRKLEQCGKAIATFGQIFPCLPKPEQGRAETKAPIGICGLDEPFERGAEIIVFEFEACHPLRLH